MATVFRSPLIQAPRPDPRRQSVPESGPQANPLLTTLKSKDSFFSGAGMGPDYHYPTPPERPYPVTMRTWTQAVNLNLRGKDKFFTSAGQGPAYDYPNPVAWRHDSSHKTWTQSINLNILSKDKFFAAAGQAPRYDYPNPTPRRDVASGWTHPSNISLYIAAAIVYPFKSTDWPTPYNRADRPDLRTWTQTLKLNLQGKDKFFGAPGQPPTYHYPLTVLRPTAELNWIDTLRQLVIAQPFQTPDLSTPEARENSIELRTWLRSVALTLIGKDKFFGAPGQGPSYDWPNPTARRDPASTWIVPSNLSLFTAVPFPFRQSDWPAPKSRAERVELRTWLDNLKLNLQGKDKFFGAPGQPPSYHYPLTISRATANELRTWIDSLSPDQLAQLRPFLTPDLSRTTQRPTDIALRTWLKPLTLTLLGKDKFFGAAGQPPNNLEWNLVKERLRAVEWILSSFAPNIPNLTGHVDQFCSGIENRTLSVSGEDRTLEIQGENRIYRIKPPKEC